MTRPVVRAHLSRALHKVAGRLSFVRVRLETTGDGWRATPTGPQGSHIQSSLVGCHGVARFPLEMTSLEEGAEVEVELWRYPDAGHE